MILHGNGAILRKKKNKPTLSCVKENKKLYE